jgi:hypothetical protein
MLRAPSPEIVSESILTGAVEAGAAEAGAGAAGFVARFAVGLDGVFAVCACAAPGATQGSAAAARTRRAAAVVLMLMAGLTVPVPAREAARERRMEERVVQRDVRLDPVEDHLRAIGAALLPRLERVREVHAGDLLVVADRGLGLPLAPRTTRFCSTLIGTK